MIENRFLNSFSSCQKIFWKKTALHTYLRTKHVLLMKFRYIRVSIFSGQCIYWSVAPKSQYFPLARAACAKIDQYLVASILRLNKRICFTWHESRFLLVGFLAFVLLVLYCKTVKFGKLHNAICLCYND